MANQASASPAHAHDQPLPSFRYAMENQAGRVNAAGSAKEANVDEFPVSEKIAAVSMRLEAGQHSRIALARHRRRMGVHAQRPLPDHRVLARRHAGSRRFWTGRRLVFPARLSAFDSSLGRRLPLHFNVRRRQVLGVRHVQPERLGWPHSAGGVGKELWRAGENVSVFPERRSVHRSRQSSRRRCRQTCLLARSTPAR